MSLSKYQREAIALRLKSKLSESNHDYTLFYKDAFSYFIVSWVLYETRPWYQRLGDNWTNFFTLPLMLPFLIFIYVRRKINEFKQKR